MLISHSQATAFSSFFSDIPHFVRRDIFTFAKVILRLRRSDIINKHKSNSLIPPQPKQGGSETKPSWGRLQPNRRLERDLFRKGGTTAWVRDGFFNKKAVTNDTKSVTTWRTRLESNQRPSESESDALSSWATDAYVSRSAASAHSGTGNLFYCFKINWKYSALNPL